MCIRDRVCRDGKIHHQKYQRGHALGELEIIGECDPEFTGTEVKFLPDKTIFEDTVYDYRDVYKRQVNA